jgi:hypothetical protein
VPDERPLVKTPNSFISFRNIYTRIYTVPPQFLVGKGGGGVTCITCVTYCETREVVLRGDMWLCSYKIGSSGHVTFSAQLSK